jgi:hypothetical protein
MLISPVVDVKISETVTKPEIEEIDVNRSRFLPCRSLQAAPASSVAIRPSTTLSTLSVMILISVREWEMKR